MVCGRIGGESAYSVEHHPRFGVVGGLRSSIVENAMQFGGDGYRIACGLQAMDASVSIVGSVGEDSFGKKLYDDLKQRGVSCDFLVQDKGAETSQTLYMTDKNGIIHSYVYDPPLPTVEQFSLNLLQRPGTFDYAVIASTPSAVRDAVFEALQETQIPLLWYTQGQVCDLNPDQLLRYLRCVQYLVVSPHERQYFCDTLGLASIDLLLKEGPRVIVEIEYEALQGSYVYNVFSAEKLPNHHFSALTGHDASSYRDIMLGFVIGMSYTAHEVAGELEMMLRIGIACSEDYLAYLLDSGHHLRYNDLMANIAREVQ